MPDGYATPPGRSIIEQLEDALDEAYSRYVESSRGDAHVAQGECIGYARAIALFKNPYNPNVKAEKLAAKERYENA